MTKEERQVYNKEYRLKNKEALKLYQKQYNEDNSESQKQYKLDNKDRQKKYEEKHLSLNKEEKKKYFKEYYGERKEKYIEYRNERKDEKKKYDILYREENGDKKKEYNKLNKESKNNYAKSYHKTKYKENSLFKLKKIIRSLIYQSIKNQNYTKKSKTFHILGCTFEEFKLYIESLFESWMTWDNQGNPKDGIFEINKNWDIDHKIPLSSAKTEEELLKLNHFSNLQPLCSYNNRFVKRDTETRI